MQLPRSAASRRAEAAAPGFLVQVAKLIAASAALQTREREIFARYTASLAALIADDTGAGADDLRPWAAAYALMGMHHSLLGFVRRRLADPASGDTADLTRDYQARGQQALDLLAASLGSYGSGN